jgi:hypothetical protein
VYQRLSNQEIDAMKQEKRNGHAFHPIMRKGGVHEKSNKAKRKADKQQMSRKAREGFDRPSLFHFIGMSF